MSRQVCSLCHFPPATCVCDALTKVSNQLEIIVLQHPSEAKAAKNTVRLLELSLERLKVVRGETPQDFAELADLPRNTTALLYPGNGAVAMERADITPRLTHLLLLDGTWKKAFKLYQTNPWLHAFTLLNFASVPDNRYVIRKAPRGDSLSTLEAAAYALQLSEGLKPEPLHRLLNTFVEKQMSGMPESVKKRYLKE